MRSAFRGWAHFFIEKEKALCYDNYDLFYFLFIYDFAGTCTLRYFFA